MPNQLRLKGLIVALGLAVGSVAMATPPAGFAGTAVIGHATRLHTGDLVSGPLALNRPMHVVVSLQLRNEAQLQAFIANPDHPNLTPTQFVAQYGPAAADANAVAVWLKQQGFRDVAISANHVLVSADGSVATAQSAFRTNMVRVHTHDGRNAFANSTDVTIPASLHGVSGVIGLQTVHVLHPVRGNPHKGGGGTSAVAGHNPVDWPAIYGGTGLQTAAGVPVGIITNGDLTQTITDLDTFTSNNGLPTVTTQIVNTDGTGNDTSGLAEWDIDSQDIVGMAGGQVGKIIFYNIPDLFNSSMVDDFNTVVSNNDTKIINVSLGECELSAQGDGSAAAADEIFQQAVAQGQTFSVATGDSGADECPGGSTGASWPANSQYVIAVAGTTLSTSGTTWSGETVWSGSGGSESDYEPQPSWQAGLFDGSNRGVADVAYPGDPNSGAVVVVNGQLQQWGGTSLSAPIFAGFWARVIATKGSNVGFAAPLLYQLPAADFHDITSGQNGGGSAGPGYDLASGLGSIIMGNAMADLGSGSPPANNPPTASFTDSASGLTVNFTNTSRDSDGSIASNSWDFGDGSTSTQANPSHTYASGGTYTVTLTVTDNDGAGDSTNQQVTVSGTCTTKHGKPCGGGGGGGGGHGHGH